MTLTPQMIAAMNKATGNNVPVNGTPVQSSRADEIRKIASGVVDKISPTDPNRPLPGSETAAVPAQPADGSARLSDIPKVIPNALSDVWNLVKQGTYGTAKAIVHDIPVAAYGLVKDQGIGNAVKNTVTSVPGAIKDTVQGMIPQSAKELANTDALGAIPGEFKELVTQNGGSYAKAALAAIKAIPGSIPEAAQNYADQIDRARQAVENHPVNELLGWLTLKSLGERKLPDTSKSKILNTPVKDVPLETVRKIPGAETVADAAGKMSRRVSDARIAGNELAQQPEPVQTAVKADIPQPQATLIHEANPTEQGLMKEMLEKQKNGVKKLVSTPEERPDAVIGREAMKTVKFLEDQKKSAIVEEGNHVKNLSSKPVDYSKTVSDFKDRLSMLGVEEGEKGRLDFSKSELSTPSSAKDRGLLQLTSDELKPNEKGDYIKPASELHTIRQRLFNETQNKNFTEPFTDRIVSMVHNDEGTSVRSGLLHDISDQAGGSGKGYESTATKNAIINDALQSFYKLIGKDAGGRETNIKNLGVGEVANRLEGNASAKVENAFQKVEDAAKKYGYENDVSVRKLVAFKTILKNIVGETQHNSLAGAVEQGSRAALPGEAADIAGNVASGKVGGTIKAVGKFIKSNTRAEQVRALENLLKGDDIKQVEDTTKIEKSKRNREEKRAVNEEEPF